MNNKFTSDGLFEFEGVDTYGDNWRLDNEDGLVGMTIECNGSHGGGYVEWNTLEEFDKFVDAVNMARKIITKEEN
jgi:hypothetical protein